MDQNSLEEAENWESLGLPCSQSNIQNSSKDQARRIKLRMSHEHFTYFSDIIRPFSYKPLYLAKCLQYSICHDYQPFMFINPLKYNPIRAALGFH